MPRNPTLRPMRSAREAIELAASLRIVAWSITAGFVLGSLLVAWWR